MYSTCSNRETGLMLYMWRIFFTGISNENLYKWCEVKISSIKISPCPRVHHSLCARLTLNTYVAPPPPPPPPFTWVLFTIGPLCSRQILFSMPLDCREGERCQVTEELLSWMSDVCEKAEQLPNPSCCESEVLALQWWANTKPTYPNAPRSPEARTDVPFMRQFQWDLSFYWFPVYPQFLHDC